MRGTATVIISELCNERRNSDIRADDHELRSKLDQEFKRLEVEIKQQQKCFLAEMTTQAEIYAEERNKLRAQLAAAQERERLANEDNLKVLELAGFGSWDYGSVAEQITLALSTLQKHVQQVTERAEGAETLAAANKDGWDAAIEIFESERERAAGLEAILEVIAGATQEADEGKAWGDIQSALHSSDDYSGALAAHDAERDNRIIGDVIRILHQPMADIEAVEESAVEPDYREKWREFKAALVAHDAGKDEQIRRSRVVISDRDAKLRTIGEVKLCSFCEGVGNKGASGCCRFGHARKCECDFCVWVRYGFEKDAEIARLRSAILTHRNQKEDDRCWLDDATLYRALGLEPVEPIQADLPPREVFLSNCARYWECRKTGTTYERPEDLAHLLAEARREGAAEIYESLAAQDFREKASKLREVR